MLNQFQRLSAKIDIRPTLRAKIARVIDEVVSSYAGPQTAELKEIREKLASLDNQLDLLRNEIAAVREANRQQHDQLASFEHRTRRDLDFAAEVRAVTETAKFIRKHLSTVPSFPDMHATLRHALSLVERNGLALEFGVYTGTTLKIIAAELTDHEVYGFDSFQGLPEVWRSKFPRGVFELKDLPEVAGAELVVGLFDQTLPAFLDQHPEPVAFVHIDCDLYSSTMSVLNALEPRLAPGVIIVFDEFFNYPSWQDHEYRAWQEFVERTGITFAYEAYTADHEQVAIRITNVPRATG